MELAPPWGENMQNIFSLVGQKILFDNPLKTVINIMTRYGLQKSMWDC